MEIKFINNLKKMVFKRQRINVLEATLKDVLERSVDLENKVIEYQKILKIKENEYEKIKKDITDIEQELLNIKTEYIYVLSTKISESELKYEVEKKALQEVCKRNQLNEKSINELEGVLNNLKNGIGAVSRETMRNKWKLKDTLLDEKLTTVECVICGCVSDYSKVQKKISMCAFAGGVLERYVCPKCGAIFGPVKFRNQSNEEYKDDYIVHYLGFDETDCTKDEKKAFYMLNPKKEGVYLNYGCGKWAETIKELREEGYNVYGYEPFAVDEESEFIITDVNILKQMRFDGIFSHDLLEHLLNPVDEILFMKSLLLTSDGLMAHATACYEYKFEYTRFHTCFYTGDSVRELCKKTGLKILNYDEDEYRNFMCYVYGIDDEKISFECFMAGNRNGEGKLIAENGGEIFGPALDLFKGIYYLNCDVHLFGGEFRLVVTAERGHIVLTSYKLENGMNKFCIDLQSSYKSVEFVINSREGQCCILKDIWFSKEEKGV